MNRKMVIFCFTLTCCLVSSCASPITNQPTVENPVIKDFETVVINTPGTLEIYQGTTESLDISGDSNVISSITTTITDKILTISSEQEIPVNSQITYKLSVKDLSSLTLNSFGVVKISAYAGADNLELIVNGQGRMDLGDLKVDNLKLVIVGSGNISADSINSNLLTVTSKDTGSVSIESGQTTDLHLDFGSGPFLGSDFKSTNATVNLTGSGLIQVWAVEKMDVTINGTGSVTYFGEPTLSMSINGGGQLTGGGNK
jgi:hypothetical protein